MTIIASNSLTLSNVNDGTITHTAYSWSADGTDRFTTVYPNLNLLTGTSEPFVMGYGIPRTTWDATNKVSKISLPITTIYNEVLPQDSGFPYTYIPGVTYTQSIYISTDAPLTGTPISFTWFAYPYGHNTGGADNLVKVATNLYRATSTYTWPSSNSPGGGRNADLFNLTQVFDFTKGTFLQFYKPKLEPGSIATPYMQSASEVTTADWPKYIGHYTDFTQADSTNPSDYTWGPMRGDDGVGIKTTVITYAISSSGTVTPSTGYTSTVPTLVKGQYLWTKTVWRYTDNSTETGYSVTYIARDGNNGTPGTNAINIDLSNKSYNFLANLEVSDSGSVMQAVAGSTTTTFTALQGTAAINITALTCTTTLPTGMTVSIGTLNALSVVVTISVDNTMITPNGVLNFSITAGGVTTTKSFSYSLAINDLTVINLAAINSNLGNVKNIYSHYNGSGGGTYSGTIEINDENIKITATNDNDSNEVSKTQMNGENGIWHSTKLQKTNLPGVYVLSNWSLTGATLSFESQQSDLTYPNGYSYASYGIDAHARNIVGDSISQTNDVRTWTPITLNNVTSAVLMYKIINGIIHLNGQGNWGSFTANQSKTIATLPAALCPTRTVNKIITTQNTNNNDKPMEIQIQQGGNVNIWSMTASTRGRYGGFEESYPLG